MEEHAILDIIHSNTVFFCVCVIEEFLIGSIVMLTLIDFIMRSVGVSGSRKSII